MIKGNDSVQRHVAQEKAALLVVSPSARQAIEQEILPQLEAKKALLDLKLFEAKSTIDQAFRTKDQVYTRLVNYKTIDQGDIQYLQDLLTILDEWAARQREGLEGTTPTEDQTITVKVEVDGADAVSTPAEAPQENSLPVDPPMLAESLGTTSPDEEIPVGADPDFDLGDVRL